jgi:drug/metabolite transporter (DMT)-like permease
VISRQTATVLGILAILFWSSTVGLVRSLAEHLGPLTAAAAIYLLAGTISCAYLLSSRARRRAFLELPRRYLLGCGSLFVLYMVCLYLAVGLAESRVQAVEVGLVNYLWPALVMALSVPLLGNRARWWLVPGILVGLAGIAVSMAQDEGYSLGGLASRLAGNWHVYALALAAAVFWGLYSNLARRWAGDSKGSAVPVFIAATGVLVLGLRLIIKERTLPLDTKVIIEVAFMAIFSGFLGYAFWDTAMRRGNMTLVTVLSYFTPVISTVVACVYLMKKAPSRGLWIGCALVTLGAFISKWAMTEARMADGPHGCIFHQS